MHRNRNLLDLILIFVGAAVLGWLYQHAGGFYDAARGAQIDHPQYDRFRSAGEVGKLLGSIAVLFFVFNLLYLPRRRMRVLHRLASLRHWMTAHVFFGIVGGGLIAMHAVFRMTSEAARLSALAVVVLIATGIVGRYLYALVPHTATGEEEPEGLAGRAEQALAVVAAAVGREDPLVVRLRAIGGVGRPPERNLVRALARVPIEPLRRLSATVQVSRALRDADARLPTTLSETQRAAARDAVAMGMAYAMAGVAGRVMRAWRPLHLVAALVMAWTAYVHIDSAFEQGYGWRVPASWPIWLGASAALPILAIVLEIRLRLRRQRPKVIASVGDGPPPEPPPTLHPYIDPNICMGSGACVAACPEGDILDLLDGRSRLVEPSHCVGHGECARNCPVGAIALVFGTSKRGVDIPDVSAHFESTVPGVYLIGEITGMGLIRNAVRQANQAVAHLVRQAAKDAQATPDDLADVCIIGAGPAGIAATLACMQAGLRTFTLEQEPAMGGAVNHYPRRKIVMLAPMDLQGFGKIKLTNASKEELLELWADVRAKTGLQVQSGVKVTGMQPREDGSGFDVCAGERRFAARRVMIAVGRRGTPRRLDVPGEDMDHVGYTVIDPQQHTGRRVVVVGGGDSALEAALAVAEAGATITHVVYRRATFDRAKAANRQRLDDAAAAGTIQLHLERNPAAIEANALHLDTGEAIPIDDVVVCVGGSLPTGLLRAAGCTVQQHFGRPMTDSP